MQLTVHIGTTKTGTSSIQRFLHNNRTDLADAGIIVPTSLGKMVHYYAPLASLAYGQSKDLANTIPIVSAEEHDKFRERVRTDYWSEVTASPGASDVVISAEQLQSRLLDAASVDRFREIFCSDFERVRIVVYVRPQLDQIVSLYSTVLRTGYAGTLVKFIKTRMQPSVLPYFDLRGIITRWGGAFGQENVIVRPYGGMTGEGGTLGDFCSILGLDISTGAWSVDENRNNSINSAGQELLNILNGGGTLDGVKRRQVISWVEENCQGKGEMPPAGLAREFQALFADGNEWVVERYFPGHPEYLVPQWPLD